MATSAALTLGRVIEWWDFTTPVAVTDRYDLDSYLIRSVRVIRIDDREPTLEYFGTDPDHRWRQVNPVSGPKAEQLHNRVLKAVGP